MNILILTSLPVTAPTGVSTYIKTLEKELQPKHTVKVLSFVDSKQYISIFFGLLTRIVQLIKPAYLPDVYTNRYLYQLVSALKKDKGRYDIVHVQDILAAKAVNIVFGPGQKMICTCHYNDDPAAEHIKRYGLSGKRAESYRQFIKDCFSTCKNYIGVSGYVLQKSRWLFPEDAKINIIPNGVDFGKMEDVLQKEQISPARHKMVITNVGFLEPRKNQVLLVEVAASLKDKFNYQDFEVQIIGEGEDYDVLQQAIEAKGLVQYVTLTGKKAEPWKVVAAGSVYLHVALNDNAPYAIIEAFGACVPVYALGNGGVPELFATAEGVLPPNMNADEIAAMLIEKQPRFAAIQQQQNAIVRRQLDLPGQIEKLLYLYADIAR